MGGINSNRVLINGQSIQFMPSGSETIAGTSVPNLIGGSVQISASNNNNNCLSYPNLILAEPNAIGGMFLGTGIGDFQIATTTDGILLDPSTFFEVGYHDGTFEVFNDGVSEMIVAEISGGLGGAFEVEARDYAHTSSFWYSLVDGGVGPDGMVGYANVASTKSSVTSFGVGDPDFPGETGYWIYGLNSKLVIGYYTTQSVIAITASSGNPSSFQYRGTSPPLITTASISESFNAFPVPSGSVDFIYIPIPLDDGDGGETIAYNTVAAINSSSIGPNGVNFISASFDESSAQNTIASGSFFIADLLGGTSQLDTRMYGTGFMSVDFSNGVGDATIEGGFQVEEDTRTRYDAYEVHQTSDGLAGGGIGGTIVGETFEVGEVQSGVAISTLSHGIASIGGIGHTNINNDFIVGFETGDGAGVGETFEVGESGNLGNFEVGEGTRTVHYNIGNGKGPLFTRTGRCLTHISSSLISSSGAAGLGYSPGIPSASGVAMQMGFESIGSTSFLITGSGEASIYFSGSGKIGVGTTNPTHSFEVSGTIKSTKEFKLSNDRGDALRFKLVKDGEGSGKDSLEISSSLDFIDFDTPTKFTAPVTMSKPIKINNTIIEGGADGGITSSFAGYGIQGTQVLWMDDNDGTRGTGFGAGTGADLFEMYMGNEDVDVTILGNPLTISGSAGSGLLDTRGIVSMSAGLGGFYVRTDGPFEVANASTFEINATTFEINAPVTASILSGGAVGDQSGSLTISGSLTFRDNEALPAISASTLYATGSDGKVANKTELHFEGMPIGPYQTVMVNSGWVGSTAVKVWIPFAEGGLTDLTATSTTTEYGSIIMPFDGYVDQVLVRSENDCGNVIVGTHIQVNGTESPSTTAGESITIDMGTDDTVQKFSFVDSAFAAGNILAISFDPVNNSGDSIATLVLKYDMSKGYTNP
tara:strand:- start:2013 stop:4799 length:2787 start_codon:yes stop_codon:yes gene_type:complete